MYPRALNQFRSKGFTLIEVMIAVAIFAVIAAISYATLSQYLVVREKVSLSYDRIQALQRSLLLIERDLRYLTNRPVRDEYGDEELAFMIDNEFGLPGELLRFTTAQPDFKNLGLARLIRVVWRLEDGELYRDVWTALDRDQGVEPVSMLIMDKIDEIEIDAYEWTDDLGLKKMDRSALTGNVPYGLELNLRLDNDQSIRRLFDLANGA